MLNAIINDHTLVLFIYDDQMYNTLNTAGLTAQLKSMVAASKFITHDDIKTFCNSYKSELDYDKDPVWNPGIRKVHVYFRHELFNLDDVCEFDCSLRKYIPSRVKVIYHIRPYIIRHNHWKREDINHIKNHWFRINLTLKAQSMNSYIDSAIETSYSMPVRTEGESGKELMTFRPTFVYFNTEEADIYANPEKISWW